MHGKASVFFYMAVEDRNGCRETTWTRRWLVYLMKRAKALACVCYVASEHDDIPGRVLLSCEIWMPCSFARAGAMEKLGEGGSVHGGL